MWQVARARDMLHVWHTTLLHSMCMSLSLLSRAFVNSQVELKATALHLIGECNQDTYPLQKKKHSLEYLRSISHLRPRTNTLGAVTRVRSALAFATHQFFRESGFQYIHTPILSASDCEGAGEMFQVSSSMASNNTMCAHNSITHACCITKPQLAGMSKCD